MFTPNYDPADKGVRFERHFAAEFRKYLRLFILLGFLHRFTSANKNPQPCDYLLICPDITLLLELKATDKDELPIANIIPHQLAQCAMADGSTPYTRAGFVIRFDQRENETWYISAEKVQEFVDTHSGPTLSRPYMEANGIRIRTYKATPTSRTNNTYDFDQFLKDIKATCG